MNQSFPLVMQIIFAIAGFICLIFSLLIGYKEKAELIAGYDPSKVTDKKGICRWIGFWTAIAGIVTILYPWVVKPSYFSKQIYGVLAFLAFILIIVVIMIVGSWRYERRI